MLDPDLPLHAFLTEEVVSDSVTLVINQALVAQRVEIGTVRKHYAGDSVSYAVEDRGCIKNILQVKVDGEVSAVSNERAVLLLEHVDLRDDNTDGGKVDSKGSQRCSEVIVQNVIWHHDLHK
jgi:hypothetical protein